MKQGSTIVVLLTGLTFLFVANATAAQQYVYPKKGQSAEQQKKDEYDCHTWAVKQTGFDPMAAQQAPPQQPAGAERGSGVRGAARGAAVGAVVGSFGGEAGKGAGIGAAAGAVAARGQSRRQNASAQQQESAQQSTKQQEYLRAKGACLEGKGYTVK